MTEQPQNTALEHIEFALQSLRKAARGNCPLGNTIVALDAIRWAANSEIPTEIADLELELRALLAEVSPTVAEIVAPRVANNLVQWGLGAAGWLLRPDDGLGQDRYSLAVVLLAELTAFHHRNLLAHRGHLLKRLVTCRLAMNAPYDPSIPLH
ncbi:hypothetical protein [Phyllobacterium sp. UNC302MFCol5.2]|uniref:hypothetical protein n=1 Tax=Phyllobacterium sp. UNC302MFCol5.2 TaxID=1449065 RepID=UPI00048529E9|nr:hypothetical protein [Phyllobacterium sp. UNC302MFCol5.2]